VPISVPERGSSNISAAELAQLQTSTEFWALLDRGIIDVAIRPNEGATLSAGPYVGRAICGSEILEVVEKIPGALGSLLGYASGSTFRLESVTGASTEIGPLVEQLVSLFLAETRKYLTNGKEFKYTLQRGVSPMVAGVIQIPATAQIRARGLVHQIAFDRPVITDETDKNVILKRALREVDQIADTVGLDGDLVTKAHALNMYFDTYPSRITERQSELATLSEMLVSSDASHSPLLALAALLLRHESFENADWLGHTTPKTWFVNLERLFEEALRKQLNRTEFAGLTVRKGSDFDRYLFHDSSHSRLEPDIVLLQDGEVVGVGDAKYKILLNHPRPSDVYQLLAHGAAFRSPLCFLAFASSEYRSIAYGQSVTGTIVHAYALDISDFENSVKAMLLDLDAPINM